ncbi:HupE / UreJ protein [Thiothrix eikelboomii]|uniref:HupE / UreJ protein n=1 Tax=Thiothrix eikelboomii TaxID=92487 RepID=A0A1T4WLS5_9GAMM|nr:HupE/UreJ family protein [Thiothrix eikelboomii]SKA78306.1 HupE / UreJ protein [Thiothrix eikelboomii]
MISFFWQGCLHPLSVPGHLLVLLALGLLLGQQDKFSLRSSLGLFVLSLVLALVLTPLLPPLQYNEFILLLLAFILSLLVIIKLPLPLGLVLCLSVSTALLLGLDSRAPRLPGLAVSKLYLHALGTSLSASLILTLLASLSFYLNKLLAGIAVRVIGAWIAASSLMVLALLIQHSLPLLTAS